MDNLDFEEFKKYKYQNDNDKIDELQGLDCCVGQGQEYFQGNVDQGQSYCNLFDVMVE